MSDKHDAILASAENNANNLDLGKLYGAILDDRWIVIISVVIMMMVGTVYTLFATPIYSSDAMVAVEKNAGQSLLNNLSEYIPTVQPKSDGEMKLLQSKLVLFKTINELNLDIEHQESFFPVFGKGWARLTNKPANTIDITNLQVPDKLLGTWLQFKAVSANSFTLSYDGKELVSGVVGKPVTMNGTTITVYSMHAAPGTEYTVRKLPIRDAYDRLVNRLDVSDAGMDTGMLEMKLKGEDPAKDRDILDSIASNYVLQNVERKSQEAANSLEFLKQQLPMIRNQLDTSEDKLNQYRQKSDSVDLNMEIHSVLETMVNLDNSLNELTFKEAEISKLYTPEHPTYRALLEKRKVLETEKQNLLKRISELPQTQQQIVGLTRNVDSEQEIFMQLLRKQQELGVDKASTVGDVRVIDYATSEVAPTFPKLGLVVTLAGIFGAAAAIAYIVMKTLIRRGIAGSRELEEQGITVYANVPLAMEAPRLPVLSRFRIADKKEKLSRRREVLALTSPDSLTVESLRSLRTSLHFAMLEAKNNILMITGAVPMVGKSFISANLASVIGLTGQRILLIDGDMRRGSLHETFGFSSRVGLSNVLGGKKTIQEVIQVTQIPSLHVITRGQAIPNPAEMLTGKTFNNMLAWASENYDLVIVDTPPVLSVTDACIIGQIAGSSLVVARFELNTVKEVALSIQRLEQTGVNVKGCILNAIVRRAASYYSYNYNYDALNTYEYKMELNQD
ncbi:polysaccharide biosynthesis tyrosine autokinase [Candidatus Pantoea multigeneris]|uniref:Polysaccharide biosynthesis tyrosine autokinase n=1 Tax=Candidatus Pantoea multigeneris TaxID=2608357 RepID=A0ABX0RCE9_9GAMM|nr:polysaccharide biosynthesis tyrosine autokinase [Pantoea multigeneris]NIF23025.1 polysaccharide biosynthesis tyrosine autokinase [Pantoea multigeneris]